MTGADGATRRGDPLAALRADGGPELDVLLSGQIFYDIIFTDLPADPAPGTEVWAAGMGSCPGGIANLAVAASRLGLRTGLAAGFGEDVYGSWCWDVLERQERVDLTSSRRFPGHSAVTVSMARHGDRSMVTHGHPLPITDDELVGDPPRSRAVITDLPPEGETAPAWWTTAAERGALVFADVGWDPTERWAPSVLDALDRCHAFSPNVVEATAYTRTETAQAAVAALAERVPLAIVTCGTEGARGIDSSTGEQAHVPPVEVVALDATGAGDVFGASLVVGTLAGWPLADRLAFSALCSALAVQQFGGSLAAPGWGDIADWWQRTSQTSGDRDLVARYGFLDDVLPRGAVDAVRRAEATLTLYSDLHEPSSRHARGARRTSTPTRRGRR
ncbi:PfkB family carbohydrate kinase [Actinotalea sp. M2MS4P-6]|uniref:carbohydrate kinase family protein n=1 Tax=Actinotalea sp. M2MS4P-6 TaxID=2983762 RepID=UPI0021E44451|nr:PfkB family carbohydrate kinase [Actinotalea sp. M2MS4P-6]MCV2394949.1 PfkB family carbohydrate kinase [Actinotalea sp. M2MS4P-6]